MRTTPTKKQRAQQKTRPAAGQEGVTPIRPPSEQKSCYWKVSEVGTVYQQDTILEEFMTLLGLYYYNY